MSLQDNTTKDIKSLPRITENFYYNEQDQTSKRLFFNKCAFNDSEGQEIAAAEASLTVYDGGAKQGDDKEVGLIVESITIHKPVNGAQNAYVDLSGIIALSTDGYMKLGVEFTDGYKIKIEEENEHQVMKASNKWGKFIELDDGLELEYVSQLSQIDVVSNGLIDSSESDTRRYNIRLRGLRVNTQTVTLVGESREDEHIVTKTNTIKAS